MSTHDATQERELMTHVKKFSPFFPIGEGGSSGGPNSESTLMTAISSALLKSIKLLSTLAVGYLSTILYTVSLSGKEEGTGGEKRVLRRRNKIVSGR